ncbi:type II secretory pathway protein [Paraburkholderia sp. Ac-20336]|nr:type II secretory pathway protein [Paraburkholderia sp. Ac-20336]MBN3802520.1 type II secretory pathway protein [Paraburkholderia sp. Ac-20336]
MRRAVVALLCCVSLGTRAAGVDIPTLPPLPVSGVAAPVAVPPPVKPLPHVRNGAFDLRFVNVGQVVDLVYGDALHIPHVIASDVLQDDRVVSFQFDSGKGDLKQFVRNFLDSEGFQVMTRDGVDYISRKPADVVPMDRETWVYRPLHRSAAYLESMVNPLFSGRVSMQALSAAANPSSASSSASMPVAASGTAAARPPMSSVAPVVQPGVSAGDQLVIVGSARDVRDVRQLVPQLDTAVGEVVVRGWAYEVDDTDGSNTGFSIASKLLGVGLNVSSGATAADVNALQFDAGRLSFAISALKSDSRFRELSSPNVRCVSGQQVRLNVGQQVPTVSSVSFQGASGTPVQSIEYQDAGVIFNVTPTVLSDVIQLNIDEEISSFVNTTTGVSGSPTKNTRSLQTVADMKDGEVIVLGGLLQDQASQTKSHEWFLPSLLDGRTTSKGHTEVVLVLQVQKL